MFGLGDPVVMRLLDLSFDEPARNLALDEALLNEAEAGRSGDTLRFWESPVPFVVLGLTQRLSEEVHEDACASDGIPILRRASGGGCVLQGRGCLNFALVLDQQGHPNLGSIRASNRHILEKVCAALKRIGLEAGLQGVSDLAIEGRKISGNAQRRRKRYLLHHGTLLYDADLALLPKYLKEPLKQPPYRAGRNHEQFVRNIPCPPEILKEGLAQSFGAASKSLKITQDEEYQLDTLLAERYLLDEWTRRR